MSRNPRSNEPRSADERQPKLPLRVAVGICLHGIRARLGRSMVTVLGVALGTAFLMSVLAGVVVKAGLADEAAAQREARRRLVVLRSQIGSLTDKRALTMGPPQSRADEMFANMLQQEWAFDDEAEVQIAAMIILGDSHRVIPPTPIDKPITAPTFLFFRPGDTQAAALDDAGIDWRALPHEATAEERASAQRIEQQRRERTIWIVAVSLLVTATCVANAMLMSVAERVREIGTMKCLGALSSFVVRLFLIESLLVGGAGGILGAAIGALVCVTGYAYGFGVSATLAAAWTPMMFAAAGGCVVGGALLAVVSGAYPAHVAARVVPAAALASNV